jgi:hypothetical protein
MAFKIALTPTYKVKVLVEIPNDKGGVDKSDFMAEFGRVDMKEIDELRAMPQREVLEKKLTGWLGLVDDDGKDVAFNPANRDALFLIPHALEALVDAFWKSLFKAREKN